MNLLSAPDKWGVRLNLASLKVDIEDKTDNSQYFGIVELNPIFTAGKNPVAFNGSTLLKEKSEIQIECLDSNNNSLYFEQAKSSVSVYTDSANFVISIHVYAETYNGPGKLIFVGKTTDNKTVRWVRNISIDKTLSNSSKVRFYNEPSLETRALLYPVVDLGLATDSQDGVAFKAASIKAKIKSYVVSVAPVAIGDNYTSDPVVSLSGGNPTIPASVSPIRKNNKIVGYTVTSTGSGYTSRPSVTVSGGGGSGATAYANITGYVSSLVIDSAGSGYSDVHPAVTFQPTNGGFGAYAIATTTAGKVTSIDIVTGGTGYLAAPKVYVENQASITVSDMNVAAYISSPCHGFAVSPVTDTNQYYVNRKKIDIDYRIVATGFSDLETAPTLNQTGSFNFQLEGREIEVTISRIRVPLSNKELDVNIVQNFRIKKVLDSNTIVLSDPFYYTVGTNKYVANIINGSFRINYNYIKYNTNPDSGLTTTVDDVQMPVKSSYVEATYKNLKTFSGFIARHKLYRRSLFYPGEFEQISDEPLNSSELLIDSVTFNRAYYLLGKFYHQFHIDKYWFASSNDIFMSIQSSPINSAYIGCNSYTDANGYKYMMVKTDTIGGSRDNIYYPYNESEYNQLSGSSYNSNFINLKKDALHAVSCDVIVYKDTNVTDSALRFYFTSSIASMTGENGYDPEHGWKLGEFSVTEAVEQKKFTSDQILKFTPKDDYFGTLKIVPYHCAVNVSNLSLRTYGDSGFSPDVLTIRVPCPLNVPNEAFEFQAELYDINSVLIPTDLKANQAFDPSGESMYATDGLGQVVLVQDGGNTTISTTETFIVNGSLNLPNLQPNCSPGDRNRLVTWNADSGSLQRTDIINIYKDDEYIVLRTGSCYSFGGEGSEGRSVNVVFDGLTGGRQIYWIGSTKTVNSASV